MIRGIFWDNDGVLVDTEGLYFEASAQVLGRIGIHLSRERFADISLRQGGSVFSLAEPRLSPPEIETLRKERDVLYSELLAGGVPLAPGVEETLRRLHGRVRMAIVTSSRREHFEIIHRRTGILDCFDFVLTREDYVQAKPAPEPYLAALGRSGLTAGECLVVEDSPRGVEAARGAGMRCLVVSGPFFPAEHFHGAGEMLKDIREVASFVEGGIGRTSAVA